jgi:hypothetical protein
VKTKQKIDKIEQRKSNLQDRLLDGEISGNDFTEMAEKVDKELALLKNTLSGLQTEMTPYLNYVKHKLPMLENLVE